MYIETSSNNQGNKVFVSSERIDIIQITIITFCHNRFSTSDVTLRAMGRFRIQLLLEENTWSTQYNIPKNDQYGNSSTDWTLVHLNFTIENYGNKLTYDQIDTPHSNMCFSNMSIPRSVYKEDKIFYFKDLFESIPDYRKVLLVFLIKNNADFLNERGFLKNDIDSSNKEFKNTLLQQYEEYLDYIKKEEDSISERNLNK